MLYEFNTIEQQATDGQISRIFLSFPRLYQVNQDDFLWVERHPFSGDGARYLKRVHHLAKQVERAILFLVFPVNTFIRSRHGLLRDGLFLHSTP